MITREVHVRHLSAAIDATHGDLLAFSVGFSELCRKMVDERALKLSGKDFLFVFDEDADTGALQGVDDAGTIADDGVVVVRSAAVGFFQPFSFFLVKEGEEKVSRGVVGEEPELVGVFDVHDFIADVVGGFDKIDQRVAGIDGGAVR